MFDFCCDIVIVLGLAFLAAIGLVFISILSTRPLSYPTRTVAQSQSDRRQVANQLIFDRVNDEFVTTASRSIGNGDFVGTAQPYTNSQFATQYGINLSPSSAGSNVFGVATI